MKNVLPPPQAQSYTLSKAYLFEELGVEKMSVAAVLIMLPAVLDTGDEAVVKEV